MISGVILLLSIFFLTFNSYPQQTDSVYGNVKKIREKVIFLTEIENPQLMYYNDYGHYGFRGPETTQAVFKDHWYNRESCYFINYERYFDETGNVVKDLWFTKGDTLMNSYKYTYDEKNRLKKEVNFTDDGIIFYEDYYYTGDEHVNIINYNSEDDFLFWHTYKKYDENDNLILERRILDDGHQYEYHYEYQGEKLKNRIYSDLINIDELRVFKTDSLNYFYKDIVNTFNDKGQIIKHQEFQRVISNDTLQLKKAVTVFQNFEGDDLTQKSIAYNTNKPFYQNYKYDKLGRLIASYCCSKDMKEAERIEKYTYKNKEIGSLLKIYNSQTEKKNYNIKFSYTYDEKGNWTEILKTVNNIDRYKWIRKIEYFD